MSDYPIRAAGIPALARVHSYLPYTAATWHAPAEGPEVEWELLTRRGKPAPWLERKLSRQDRDDIESELLTICSQAYRQARDRFSPFSDWSDEP